MLNIPGSPLGLGPGFSKFRATRGPSFVGKHRGAPILRSKSHCFVRPGRCRRPETQAWREVVMGLYSGSIDLRDGVWTFPCKWVIGCQPVFHGETRLDRHWRVTCFALLGKAGLALDAQSPHKCTLVYTIARPIARDERWPRRKKAGSLNDDALLRRASMSFTRLLRFCCFL